ncbi:hypothetical protein M0R89_07460 [Halorussus limi]|uniref:Uncharacterized protein n=1 Tax=Halorussus limi TaxID=2938695 RepID=A0A8U0HZ12_9EURY|nr:hypothetical protein [Halorussus limi]UPV75886.1 hypothetical protein M0R89_07460 [Halorussus limi]
MKLKSDGDWDFLYEEVKRRVDYQIEAHRRFENQASRLLRIVLTAISVTIGVISALASTSGGVSLPNNILQINRLSNQIHSAIGFIGESQATLIAILLSISVFLLVSFSISNLFVGVPVFAYKVMNPSTLQPSIEGRNVLSKHSDPDTDSEERRQVLREYKTIIENNEDILSEAKENWEKCYNSLRNGVVTFTASALIFVFSFIYYHAQLASLSLLGLTMWLGFYLQRNYTFADVYPYITADFRIEVGVLFLTLYAVANYPPILKTLRNGPIEARLLTFFLILSLFSFTWRAYSIEMEKLQNLIVRSIFIALSSATLVLIFTIGFPNMVTGYTGELLVAGLLWGMVYFIGSFFMLVIVLLRKSEEKLSYRTSVSNGE